MKYEKLFSPYKIGKITVKNRFALSPMSMPFGMRDGCMWTEAYVDHLVERAKGGAGLIFTQCIGSDMHVDLQDTGVIVPAANPQKFVESSRRLLDECHAYGAKVFCQVTAGTGRNGGPGFKTPSPLPYYSAPTVTSEALTVEEIAQKVADFAASAAVIQAAGFDGIELHAIHWGYLFDEFAMSLMNQRTDAYGGSLENRMRFIKEVIFAIRSVCGPDFPISVRLAVKTFIKGFWQGTIDEKEEAGRTPEEAAEIAKLLESYGVDVINADMGIYDNWIFAMPNVYMPKGLTLKYMEPVKKAVSIPVLCGGCRLSEAMYGRARCAVNPILLADEEYEVRAALKPRKIIVVGGGPAGMEAAITAAARGHKVELYEQADELGGNLIPAGGHPFKEDIRKLNAWFRQELGRHGVTVHTGRALSPEDIKALSPDVVLLAVGSRPIMPSSIKGVENCIDAVSAATGRREAGQKVVVAGGGLTGCEIALDYAMQGKEVTLVEYMDTLMSVGLPNFFSNTDYLTRKMMEYGVRILTGHRLDEVGRTSVTVTNLNTKEQISIDADDTVMAIGLAPNNSMYADLIGCGFEVYELGDGVSVGNIGTSIYSAYRIARRV